MFKPKTLKEAISLARIRDDQLNQHGMKPTPTFNRKLAPSMKQLSCDWMQKRHIHGICFNCDEKFTPGHRCKGPQLLLLEGNVTARTPVPDPTQPGGRTESGMQSSFQIQFIFFLLVKHISNAHFVKDIYLYENIFVCTNST